MNWLENSNISTSDRLMFLVLTQIYLKKNAKRFTLKV